MCVFLTCVSLAPGVYCLIGHQYLFDKRVMQHIYQGLSDHSFTAFNEVPGESFLRVELILTDERNINVQYLPSSGIRYKSVLEDKDSLA